LKKGNLTLSINNIHELCMCRTYLYFLFVRGILEHTHFSVLFYISCTRTRSACLIKLYTYIPVTGIHILVRPRDSSFFFSRCANLLPMRFCISVGVSFDNLLLQLAIVYQLPEYSSPLLLIDFPATVSEPARKSGSRPVATPLG
jgi:hypothetical protein